MTETTQPHPEPSQEASSLQVVVAWHDPTWHIETSVIRNFRTTAADLKLETP